jgi:hypothetical protein
MRTGRCSPAEAHRRPRAGFEWTPGKRSVNMAHPVRTPAAARPRSPDQRRR